MQRCNSYLENYNKIIKSSIGDTSKISWPKFITFIQEKESLYTKKILETEKSTSYNGLKIYALLKIKFYNSNNNIFQNNKTLNNPLESYQIKRYFYKWNNNICRLDSSFFFICIYNIWLY